MKTIQQRALLAYEAPEAEEILIRIEENILSETVISTDQDIPNLEEENGWGDSIWG